MGTTYAALRSRGRFALRLLAAGLALSATPLSAAAQEGPATPVVRAAPADLGDGWAWGRPQDLGLDPGPIAELLRRVEEGELADIHGVLIARAGTLAVEAYFPGYAFDYAGESFRGPWTEFGASSPHNLASVTKSVTGLLVGIAVDRGAIEGVDGSVVSFFPEYVDPAEGRESITLGHLLTMTSGLEWNEQDVFYGEARNDIIQLFLVPDPLEYILSRPLAAPAATEWRYNGGGTILLGEIVHRASGLPLDDFAQAHLFDPLGIERPEWVRFDNGVVYASGDLRLRPRDMAKLGQLVLDGGIWKGRRIVSAEWVEAMTRVHVPFQPSGGYGLHWWTRVYANGPHSAPAYMADGWGGQRIMVFPTLDLVVVFTGGSYTAEHRLDEIVARHVLPAVEGSGWP